MNNTIVHRQLHKVKDKFIAIAGGVIEFCNKKKTSDFMYLHAYYKTHLFRR